MMPDRTLNLRGRLVGPGQRVYIIAEMSANHNQDLDLAMKIVEEAARAGADAIKTQTFLPETMTVDCDNEHFRIKGTIWEDQNLHQLYLQAYTPWDWQEKLRDRAHQLGMQFFSTAYDSRSVDFLEQLDVPAYKVASFEAVDLPLLERIGRTGRPVLLSTGMADLGEIEEAVNTLRCSGCPALALLKCTSAYPAPPDEMNLRIIPHLSEAFQVPVGLSDHSLDLAVPIAAVAVGAAILEKHFILERSAGGLDSQFSLEPGEFKQMVDQVRVAEMALGHVRYGSSPKELESRALRRSLFVVRDIRSGERFNQDNVRSVRPASGLHTRYYRGILGRRALTDILRGTPLSWDLVDSSEV